MISKSRSKKNQASSSLHAEKSEPPSRSSGLPLWAALLLSALVPLLVFWPTLDFGLLLDDIVLFEKSPTLSDMGSIGEGFLKDVGALRKGTATVNSSYYRPVFLALSTIYHQLSGGDAADWHALCVGLAAVIGALSCFFFSRLGFAPLPALLASLVFSLHPSHVSSVAWASGLQELFAALFALLALLVVLAWSRQESSGPKLVFALLLFYALALLSKEMAMGLLPFVAGWAFFERRRDPVIAARLGRAAAYLAGVSVLYLIARVAVLGGRLAVPAENAPSFLASLPALPVALFSYVRLLLWPFSFSIFRPERPFHELFSWPVLLSALALGVLAALAVWAVRRRPALLPPLLLFVGFLLPVLNLWVLHPQWMVTDRYLFLPSLALPWVLLLVLPARAVPLGLGALVLVFAPFSWHYAAIFESERTFIAAMEKAEPTSPLIFAEKGRLLAQDGDRAGARAAYLRAVKLDPIAPAALENLGDLALEAGDLAAAEDFYRRALVVRPYASRGFKLVVVALSRSGRQDEARTLVAEAAERWPEDFQVRLLQSALLWLGGRPSEAGAAFEAARTLRPGDPAVAGGMELALRRFLPTIAPSPRFGSP